jgi:ferredoxin
MSGGDLTAAAGAFGVERWAAATAVHNSEHHVPRATLDPRYAHETNSKPPRKLGSHLTLFDCVTCSKCVPVCPNDANFTYVLPAVEQPIVKVRHEGGVWVAHLGGNLDISKKLQYANFADFCNECGNCDVFCPEDGGPYQVKPRFFGSAEDWRHFAKLDGFAMEFPGPGRRRLLGRIDGRDLSLEIRPAARGYPIRAAPPRRARRLDEPFPLEAADRAIESPRPHFDPGELRDVRHHRVAVLLAVGQGSKDEESRVGHTTRNVVSRHVIVVSSGTTHAPGQLSHACLARLTREIASSPKGRLRARLHCVGSSQ